MGVIKVNTFLYIILGVIGTIFGSFFTLAVYRIPRKENIVYVRSHCTTCNHRLEFWDLIPVLSYVFLGGKCRYCKETIRPRYLILELLSGLVFILIAVAMNISVMSSLTDFMIYGYTALIVSVLCILMGIGKNIPYSVIIFGMLVRTLYFVFFDMQSFEMFFIETACFMVVALISYLCINTYFSKKKNENSFLERNYPKTLETILLVAFLVYIFGINIVVIIMSLALFVGLFIKYILKKEIDYITYICFISIVSLILISNVHIYEYISSIF